MKKRMGWIIICILSLCLAGCGKEPSGDGSESRSVRELTMVVTEDDISQLSQYPDLERVDLSGSTCYEAIARYMADHPQVAVTYTVSLGDTVVSSTETTLTLAQGSYDYDALLADLGYLPAVSSVTLPKTELTMEQILALRTAYPDVTFDYTIVLDGKGLSAETAFLDLSGLEPEQVAQYAAKLSLLPELTRVELMGGDGSKLSVADVKTLQAAAPNAVFNYTFDLFGKTVSTADETVEFENVDIGNEGEQTIRDALDILKNCTYFKLDNCGLDNEVLAGIRDDYPDTKVVWRVYVWQRSWLTDTQVLRAVYHVDDTNSEPLKYLTEVKYMDLGHNTEMVDISFCAYMPDLEIAILSGSPIVDLTPLASCKKLEFLELAWCGHLKDVTPLAQCTGLKNLNLGHTRVSDLSPLKDLPLELLSFVNSGNKAGLTEEYWQTVQAQHPDCWITYEPMADSDATPYSKGWRYTKEGGYTQIYRKVRDVFGYDEIDKKLQN